MSVALGDEREAFCSCVYFMYSSLPPLFKDFLTSYFRASVNVLVMANIAAHCFAHIGY